MISDTNFYRLSLFLIGATCFAPLIGTEIENNSRRFSLLEVQLSAYACLITIIIGLLVMKGRSEDLGCGIMAFSPFLAGFVFFAGCMFVLLVNPSHYPAILWYAFSGLLFIGGSNMLLSMIFLCCIADFDFIYPSSKPPPRRSVWYRTWSSRLKGMSFREALAMCRAAWASLNTRAFLRRVLLLVVLEAMLVGCLLLLRR